jgi:hypothetical protein
VRASHPDRRSPLLLALAGLDLIAEQRPHLAAGEEVGEAGEEAALFDEVLECGHRLSRQRPTRRRAGTNDLPLCRRCPHCPRLPPRLDGLTEDAGLPYDPRDPARPGWFYATPSGRPALKPTRRVVIHLDCLAALPRLPDRDYAMCRADRPCPECGRVFTTLGGLACHLKKHGREKL